DAPLDSRKDGAVKFVAPPKVVAAGNTFTISFEVSAATDVEVAILDEKGVVVRHLAAGLLGKNAPAPFKKDELTQSVIWNGEDDAGKAVSGHCKARISLGA